MITTQPFEKGGFICEYAGELIDAKEAHCREELYEKDAAAGSYLYYFDDQNKKLW